jgi:hypothetical protein
VARTYCFWEKSFVSRRFCQAARSPLWQDLDQEDNIPEPFHEAPVDKVRELMRAEAEKKKKKDAIKAKLLHGHGFEGDLANV